LEQEQEQPHIVVEKDNLHQELEPRKMCEHQEVVEKNFPDYY